MYFVENGNLPNLLFSSPPGMGKTTISYCLGHQLLQDKFKVAFIELNASEERNISDIRTRVKDFAQRQISLPLGRHKIIFLDECDSMTSQAQLALRRIMEDYQDTTRFILACNIVQKIVEPLQSRCCVITLQPPSTNDIAARLRRICELANIKGSDECLQKIAELADGDVRNAVNNLQTVSLSLHGELTLQGIKDTLDYIEIDRVDAVYKKCKEDLAEAWKYIDDLISNGFSVDEIVNAFYKYGLDAKTKMSDQERAKYLKIVAQAHSRIASGIGT